MSTDNELIALRLWKEDAQEALNEYRVAEKEHLEMIAEMHGVIAKIANTAHDQQLLLSKYIEVKADYFATKGKKKS